VVFGHNSKTVKKVEIPRNKFKFTFKLKFGISKIIVTEN